MNIRDEIKKLITDALQQSGIEHDGEIVLDYPADMSHGDFATPVALKLGKQLGRNPRDVAESIVKGLGGELPSFIDKVEVAGPGFINITLSKEYWSKLVGGWIPNKGEKWGSSSILKGQKYLIEHTSVNLFKPFHIGHLLSNTTGESLTRIIGFSGAENTVLSYPSDVSPGIAKAVWGLINKGWSDDVTIEHIGEAYAHSTVVYKENADAKIEMDQINKDLYNKVPSTEYDVYQKGLAVSLDYFKNFTNRLGSHFDGYIYESEAEVEGKQVIAEHSNIFIQSEGAVVFEGSKHGLFDNVFINSAGFATYLGKDVGLITRKFREYEFDQSVLVIDVEQKPHFTLMKKAVEQFQPDWVDKYHLVYHGRLSLTSGRISSRDGGVPMAEELIEEVKQAVVEKSQERALTDIEATAETIAQAALKYAVLKSQAGKNIVFDMNQALAMEGASGPYIQYAYVRAQSALSKISDTPHTQPNDDVVARLRHGEVPTLERMLLRFPDMVEKSLHDYSPHHIAVYLHELASEFNSFYAQTKIADETNPDYLANIQLVKSFAQTIKNGLWLLGIETVEQM